MHGVFRLRSFHNVLNFIGQSLKNGDNPEFAVGKFPQTPEARENPVHTMALTVSDDEPKNADFSAKIGGRYYSLMPESGYQWNHEGFRLLFQKFQMTVTELAKQGAPMITIAK